MNFILLHSNCAQYHHDCEVRERSTSYSGRVFLECCVVVIEERVQNEFTEKDVTLSHTSSNFANSWQKHTPGYLKQTHLHSTPRLHRILHQNEIRAS